MRPKLLNLKIVLGHRKENMNQSFRFNNPKPFSNWIILVSFYSSCRVIKNDVVLFLHLKTKLKTNGRKRDLNSRA
jgi:hypothetical protein